MVSRVSGARISTNVIWYPFPHNLATINTLGFTYGRKNEHAYRSTIGICLRYTTRNTLGKKGIVMAAVRISTTIEHDGELRLDNLPFKKGQRVALFVVPEATQSARPLMTAHDLLSSPIVGLWADRTDLGDSLDVARQLRNQMQRRAQRDRRIRPICQRAATRICEYSCRPHGSVELRSSGGTGNPLEIPQTPNVWPRQF